MRYLLILLALSSLSAEVVEYSLGDTIAVPLQVNAGPTTEHIRTLILVGPTKLSVKGTWRAEDLDVIQNGNTIRLALRSGSLAEIPVGILGDNGVYYHVVVKPVPADAKLDPVINVIAANRAVAGAAGGDPGQTAGGAWEHTTNLTIRLQKHIRGGRQIPEASGSPQFNQELLEKEGRRVPGRRWTETDDWRVMEYYTWTLGNVSAHYIGVTYRGREREMFFDYFKQRTDQTRAIWHQPVDGEPQVYNRKFPGVPLIQGREEFFILYTEEAP